MKTNTPAWKIRTVTKSTRTSAATARGADFTTIPSNFLRGGVSIDEISEAQPAVPVSRAGGAAPPLDLSVECGAGERALLAIRYPTGALTFHAASEVIHSTRGATSTGRSAGVARFRVSIRAPVVEVSSRRGLISSALRLIVLKVRETAIDRLVSAGVRLVAPTVEGAWWRARGLHEGWHEVNAASLISGKLRAAQMGSLQEKDRALLFLHGTFSHAAAGFSALPNAPGGFFNVIPNLYGGRLFAFNHFSLSKSPEENAKELLESLPSRTLTFDVITHSRGGLVLRTLVEQGALFGPLANRFKLGHAVLVASPNVGTPLATPSRWEQTLGLVANLLEMIPDNPWTTAAEFVADGIVTLASHAALDLPGLSCMNADGETIAALQQPPGPNPDGYSALGANFHPNSDFWQRLLDAGIDTFFGGANDLVVPAEGSWRVDAPSTFAIPAERIGCFGPGGNLSSDPGETVHHLNFFRQEETIHFLLNALQQKPQSCAPLAPDATLPARQLSRGGQSTYSRSRPQPSVARSSTVETDSRELAVANQTIPIENTKGGEVQILLLHERDEKGGAQILATYGGARVLELFETRNLKKGQSIDGVAPGGQENGDRPGTRFQRIIRTHKRIQSCLDGIIGQKMPTEIELGEFGEDLFNTLIRGNIKRLYDVARSEHREGPLNVVFSSTIPWLSEIPWEFAFDPSRRKFLATEEIHFIRNVITAVPAQRIIRAPGPLHILIVAAQPLGLAGLSIDDEVNKLMEDFAPLLAARLAVIDVLPRATPSALHDKILGASYDVVHFVGHGDFDEMASKGILLFENAFGGKQQVNTRTLRELLCMRGIQLVFLNACESGRGARHEKNRGVAQALVEGGMPAVVANQYKVLDPSAVAFAERFYWSLAQGATLGESAREARISLNYNIAGETIDWAIPVLFARDADYRLLPLTPSPLPMPNRLSDDSGVGTSHAMDTNSTIRPSKRRVAREIDSPIRIAIADLDRRFPALVGLLERLNTVQSRFHFATRDIVAPLGSWCLKKGEDIRYLVADRFAERIKNHPKELGVDLLACITGQRMMQDDDSGTVIYNIYGWWGDPGVPVMIFSTDQLEIPVRGVETNRILTNMIVEGLTGYLANTGTHARGPKNCPLYFNPERDIELLACRMKFDRHCRAILEKKIPRELGALESLLKAITAPEDMPHVRPISH